MESPEDFGLSVFHIGSLPADCAHWSDSSDCVSCGFPLSFGLLLFYHKKNLDHFHKNDATKHQRPVQDGFQPSRTGLFMLWNMLCFANVDR